MTISVGNNSNEVASFYHNGSVSVTSGVFYQLNITQASLTASDYTVGANSVTILSQGKYELQLGTGNLNGTSRIRVNGVDKLIGSIEGGCFATSINLAIGDVVIMGLIPTLTASTPVRINMNIKRVA